MRTPKLYFKLNTEGYKVFYIVDLNKRQIRRIDRTNVENMPTSEFVHSEFDYTLRCLKKVYDYTSLTKEEMFLELL